MASCPKCGDTDFRVEKYNCPLSVLLVVCVECDSVVSSVEHLNFRDLEVEMKENLTFIKKELNTIRDDMWSLEQDIQRKYDYIVELLEMTKR